MTRHCKKKSPIAVAAAPNLNTATDCMFVKLSAPVKSVHPSFIMLRQAEVFVIQPAELCILQGSIKRVPWCAMT